jgi:hypothetical protein
MSAMSARNGWPKTVATAMPFDAPVAGPPDRSGAPEKPETTGSR